MKCKDCGAHLPYGAYGQIRCEFCNAPNYVPIPGEKEEKEKEPIKKEIEKESTKKGLMGRVVKIVIVLFILGLFTWAIFRPTPIYEDDVSIYFDSGLAYAESGEYSRAIIEFDMVIELDPNYALAYFHRGFAYGELGQGSKAISDYSTYIELNPSDAAAYNNRAIAYNSLGEYTKAISDYDKAIKLDPNYALAYYNRGLDYKSLGESEKAQSDFQMAASLDPTKYTPPPPIITLPPHQPITPPPSSLDAIDMLPVSILGYSTDGRDKNFLSETDLEDFDYCGQTTAVASYINIGNQNMDVLVIAIECNSKEDAEDELFNLLWDIEEEEGINFMETTLEENIYAEWALTTEGDAPVATFIWNQNNFLIIAYAYAEEGEDAFDAGRYIANSIILQSPTKTPAPTTTAPPTTPPALGTRTNPAPIGYALSTEFEDWDDKYEAKLTVLEVIRGTDAWNRLIDADMFNSPPKEDHEYILAKIKFEYLSGPNIDTSYDVSTYSFNIISSGGKEYEVPLAVEPEPAMDASLYPGAFHEGWVAYEVAVEDSQPLLAFGRDYQGRGGIWFKLYEPPTTTAPPTTTPPPKTIPLMVEDNYPLGVMTYSVIEELPNYKIKVDGTVKNIGNDAVNKGWIIATFILTHDRPSKEMRVFFIDDPFLPGEIQNFRFRSDMTKDVVESVKLSTGAG